jgi:hypothetical protein
MDVESGSIKTWILCVGSTPLIIRILQKYFEKTLLLNEPLHVGNLALSQMNPSLILDISCA